MFKLQNVVGGKSSTLVLWILEAMLRKLLTQSTLLCLYMNKLLPGEIALSCHANRKINSPGLTTQGNSSLADHDDLLDSTVCF